MNKFMLSTAGISAAAIGGAASAGSLLTFNYDYYMSESGWTISDSNGDMVATGAQGVVTSATVSYTSSLTSGPAYPYGYQGLVDINLAAGDYTITLTDTWGDGWEYFSPTGSGNSAFVYGSYALAFLSGSAVEGAFTVVPAPGALALLGLAGLAGRRRRN